MNKQGRASEIERRGAHHELFPIREVSRITGVNAVTLRAWERRYGLIQPTRTDSGHRLYSQADIDEILRILGWLERGVAISKVGSILVREQAEGQGSLASDTASGWQAQLRDAVQRFDDAALDRLFDQVFAAITLDQVFADVFMPVWHDMAAKQAVYGHTSEWLFLDQFLRGRVFTRLQLSCQRRGRHVLLAPLPGQCLELELLVNGLLLASDDVGVTPLMPGQSLEELALVSERLLPDAVVLFSNRSLTLDTGKRLSRLAVSLRCPLLLAGEAAELAQESLAGSLVACLGAQSELMRRRLRQYLAGQLDT
ncbi:MerR family transcriptional regulator [Pseudomonas plecoglossicida]|uniref:MerR family transcriptional regulator n=1 Tax=Pseudomonas plecoglossicida TaxID=70775 RepID=A0AAD0VVF5_PSEDL|nr:MerR family transcriptional regulator [Pseudomonas plecoglossicida]AXM99029.1 MerR family transcriptional regulator [Pseudomonas plecoglossicida]EPB93142.1 MerR family transcriptional regulator [Pseudomonas plecoglossicida NB2011]QLB57175.1 MerR family transcriptional regulator [Pseudomonas plecoglossicida]